jgi:DDE superfamily endonuclease
VGDIKKNDLKPWQKHQWCLAQINGEFLARMEEILDLYEQPYDPVSPVVCFDERPCQLIGNVVMPLAMRPGSPAKEDSQYHRNGTCCVLMAVEPLRGWRKVQVFRHRTKKEYARFMRTLVQEWYPDAQRIRLVQDNLNTHSAGSFYEVFPPEEAHHLMEKLEFHYTPKKASWLNMAEIELAALTKQCLDRRIADQTTLAREIRSYERKRNRLGSRISWRFTTNQARTTLARHYTNAKQSS